MIPVVLNWKAEFMNSFAQAYRSVAVVVFVVVVAVWQYVTLLDWRHIRETFMVTGATHPNTAGLNNEHRKNVAGIKMAFLQQKLHRTAAQVVPQDESSQRL